MKAKKVLNALIISIFSFFVFVYPNSVFSMCDTSETLCYHFKSGKLVNHSKCIYSVCANTNGGAYVWKWPNGDVMSTVSGNPSSGYGESGAFFNEKRVHYFTKDKYKMGCFRLAKKKEVFCGIVLPME